MSEIGTTTAESLMELAQQQVEDSINQVVVKTKVALQLQSLRWQATTLGIGAQVVEHTLGSPKKENNDEESWPSRVGRVLDRYL